MPSVTLWDYRRILELRVPLTQGKHYNLAAYVLLQQIGFVREPAVGRTKPPHDTC